MRTLSRATLAAVLLLTGTVGITAAASADLPHCPHVPQDVPDIPAPVPGADIPDGSLLTPIGTFGRGVDVFDTSAAEIVAHHPPTQRLFVINAGLGVLDVLDISDPASPTFVTCMDLGQEANSVEVVGDLALAVVVGPTRVDPGQLVLFDAVTLAELNRVTVGVLPDMAAVTPDGAWALVANEAEPAEDFDGNFDAIPHGSVSIVPLTNPAALTDDHVLTVGFDDFEGLKDPVTGLARVAPNGGELVLNAGQPNGVVVQGRARLNPLFTSVASDLEPEYIVVNPDGATAYVALQENNAIGVLDLTATPPRFTRIFGLDVVDHAQEGNFLSPNDRAGVRNSSTDLSDASIPEAEFADPASTGRRDWPVFGLPMPDGIALATAGGRTYVLTADEGDAREWGSADTAPEAEECDNGLVICDTNRLRSVINAGNAAGHGLQEPWIVPLCTDEAVPATSNSQTHKGRLINDLRGNAVGGDATLQMGRLNISIIDGLKLKADGTPLCRQDIHALGTRGFGIHDASTGQTVFHSGDDFEQIVLERNPRFFNSNHREASYRTRSDDKGIEPEDIRVATIRGRTLAFIGLERQGGVMVYDVTDPTAPVFLEYANNRDFAHQYAIQQDGPAWDPMVGDLGSEGQLVIDRCDSPNGQDLYVAANEVSGTVTIWQIDAGQLGPRELPCNARGRGTPGTPGGKATPNGPPARPGNAR